MWKRALDLGIGVIALVIAMPVIAIISVLVMSTSRGPAFFTQRRVGAHGKEFTILKFRTMTSDSAGIGLGLATSRDDERVTRIGRLLREFHLDELAQLFNVLVGDMSLVGPRPTVPSQVACYSQLEKRRLEVKPGITGLAQVSGQCADDSYMK